MLRGKRFSNEFPWREEIFEGRGKRKIKGGVENKERERRSMHSKLDGNST